VASKVRSRLSTVNQFLGGMEPTYGFQLGGLEANHECLPKGTDVLGTIGGAGLCCRSAFPRSEGKVSVPGQELRGIMVDEYIFVSPAVATVAQTLQSIRGFQFGELAADETAVIQETTLISDPKGSFAFVGGQSYPGTEVACNEPFPTRKIAVTEILFAVLWKLPCMKLNAE
jgi:hypothetical protein